MCFVVFCCYTDPMGIFSFSCSSLMFFNSLLNIFPPPLISSYSVPFYSPTYIKRICNSKIDSGIPKETPTSVGRFFCRSFSSKVKEKQFKNKKKERVLRPKGGGYTSVTPLVSDLKVYRKHPRHVIVCTCLISFPSLKRPTLRSFPAGFDCWILKCQ